MGKGFGNGFGYFLSEGNLSTRILPQGRIQPPDTERGTSGSSKNWDGVVGASSSQHFPIPGNQSWGGAGAHLDNSATGKEAKEGFSRVQGQPGPHISASLRNNPRRPTVNCVPQICYILGILGSNPNTELAN